MASAASEKNIRKQRAQQAKDRETDKTVVKSLMAHPDGRRWMWLKLQETMVFHEGESLDPTVMAYQKGIRNGGLRLLDSITRNTPEMYVQMFRENTAVELKPEGDEPEEEEVEE